MAKIKNIQGFEPDYTEDVALALKHIEECYHRRADGTLCPICESRKARIAELDGGINIHKLEEFTIDVGQPQKEVRPPTPETVKELRDHSRRHRELATPHPNTGIEFAHEQIANGLQIAANGHAYLHFLETGERL